MPPSPNRPLSRYIKHELQQWLRANPSVSQRQLALTQLKIAPSQLTSIFTNELGAGEKTAKAVARLVGKSYGAFLDEAERWGRENLKADAAVSPAGTVLSPADAADFDRRFPTFERACEVLQVAGESDVAIVAVREDAIAANYSRDPGLLYWLDRIRLEAHWLTRAVVSRSRGASLSHIKMREAGSEAKADIGSQTGRASVGASVQDHETDLPAVGTMTRNDSGSRHRKPRLSARKL